VFTGKRPASRYELQLIAASQPDVQSDLLEARVCPYIDVVAMFHMLTP
jgi:hypothetical protein